MREIKFRAWDNITKTMTVCRNLVEWFDVYVQFEYDTKAIQIERISQFKFLEYTGLKDVNGKEIYEGDIVKNRFFDECENLIAEETNIVDFNRAAFVFAPSYKHRGLSIDGFSQRYHWRYIEHEVIGNVYENPERLELEHTNAKHSCD